MKTIIMAIAILLAGTATFAQAKQNSTHKHHHSTTAKKYTCTMHPEVVKNKPGKCPKCGMKLIAMKTKKNQS
jgi:Heavy metal binding domain